jgi:hypothetical protein
MYSHPYLMKLMADEHTRDMTSTAAAARLARQARRSRHAQQASHAAQSRRASHGLLRTIPQPRKSEETMTHRAA